MTDKTDKKTVKVKLVKSPIGTQAVAPRDGARPGPAADATSAVELRRHAGGARHDQQGRATWSRSSERH